MIVIIDDIMTLYEIILPHPGRFLHSLKS